MEYLTLLALLGVCIVAFNEYQRVKDRLSLMDEKLNYLYNQLKTLKAENQQLKTAETANQPEPNQNKKTEASVATKPVFDQKREEITLPTSRHKPANYSQIPVQQPVEFQVESQAFHFQGNNKSSLFSFEKEFGARLPVWIGAIALILAGVFLVKYSIDQGILTPPIRVMLGLFFGFSLLGFGLYFRIWRQIANYLRISQAFSGSGLAVLFVCIYAANQFYQLISFKAAFYGLILVTSSAVSLSLIHGLPIAILGVASGFLTPLVLPSQSPSATSLFIYLFLLNLGLAIVFSRKQWHFLFYAVIAANLFYVVTWIYQGSNRHDDFLTVVVFMVATSMLVLVVMNFDQKQRINNYIFDEVGMVPQDIVAVVSNYLFLSSMILHFQFQQTDWIVYWIITAGLIVLARYNQPRFGLIPLLSVITLNFLLVLWQTTELQYRFNITIAFTLLFLLSGMVFQWHSTESIFWAGLVSASSISLYLISYFIIGQQAGNHFWLITAMVLSIAMLLNIVSIYRTKSSLISSSKNTLLAIYICTFSAFFTIGLMIETPRDFLPIVIAIEMLVASRLLNLLKIESLRWVTDALCAAFLVVIFPQLLMLVELSAYSFLEYRMDLVKTLPLVQWPVFQLGLPAALFLLTANQLRQKEIDSDIPILELISISMTGLMLYYVNRHLFHSDNEVLFAVAGFTERAITTNALFLFGICCMFIGKKYDRITFSKTGALISLLSIIRIILFDFLKYNPLLRSQNVGEIVLINSLILAYGLPILWLFCVILVLWEPVRSTVINYIYGFMLLLLFTLVSLNVRLYFHPSDLTTGKVPLEEIYAYSVAWIVLAISLLIAGTLYKSRNIRFASFVMMLLSILKVFLFDASELDGILRVLAFLGLGLSLIGLSWFYTRFILRTENDPTSVKS